MAVQKVGGGCVLKQVLIGMAIYLNGERSLKMAESMKERERRKKAGAKRRKERREKMKGNLSELPIFQQPKRKPKKN